MVVGLVVVVVGVVVVVVVVVVVGAVVAVVAVVVLVSRWIKMFQSACIYGLKTGNRPCRKISIIVRTLYHSLMLINDLVTEKIFKNLSPHESWSDQLSGQLAGPPLSV